MLGAERGRILRRAADLLRKHNSALVEFEARDTGKPIAETEAVDILSDADAAITGGESVDLGGEAFGYTRREPLGLTAEIYKQADLPGGVFTVLQGWRDVGRMLPKPPRSARFP